MTIVVAGEALYDLVPAPDGSIRAHPGGGPFTAARAVARLGGPAAYLGRLSTDGFGRRLEALLREDGVGLGSILHAVEPTTLAVAEVGEGGAASYRFYTRGTASAGLTPADALAALPDRVDILMVGALGLVMEPSGTAMEGLVERLAGRALVALDPNCRASAIHDEPAYRGRLARLLAGADVVKASEEDLAWLAPGVEPERAARQLLEHGPRAALVTLGARGALVLTAAGAVTVPAPEVEVVDTIGAGDAFAGAFLAWWQGRGLGRDDLAHGELLTEAAGFANLVAARTCERAGAVPPRQDEL